MPSSRSLSIYLILLLSIQSALTGPAAARKGERGGEPGRGQSGQQRISPAEAGERVRRQTGGRVLGVTPSGDGYRVKVLTPQGQVRRIQVPGR